MYIVLFLQSSFTRRGNEISVPKIMGYTDNSSLTAHEQDTLRGLMAGLHLFHSSNVRGVQAIVNNLISPHTLKTVGNSENFSASWDGIPRENISIFHSYYSTGVEIDAGKVPDYYLIQTIISGYGEITNGSQSASISPGVSTICSPDQYTYIKKCGGSRHIIVRISRSVLESHLSNLIEREVREPVIFELLLNPQDRKSWNQLLLFLWSQLSSYNLALEKKGLTRAYAEMVLTFLLTTQHHNYSSYLKTSERQILPWYIKRAEELIYNNRTCLYVHQIAGELKVTTKTLQNGFKRYLNVTPSEYIQNVKLYRVHQELSQANTTDIVTDILQSNGISNGGRFAALYKKKYGCLPSETLKRSKFKTK